MKLKVLLSFIYAFSCILTFIGCTQRDVPEPVVLAEYQLAVNGEYNFIEHVVFADGMNGFATYNDMSLMKTEDGGLTWTEVFSGDIAEVVYPHRDTAYIFVRDGIVYNSEVYRTYDGGDTWTQMPDYPHDNIYASFYSGKRGYSRTSSSIGLKHTTNGAQTWTQPIGAVVGSSMLFVNSNLGYCIFNNGFNITQDGGLNWSPYLPGAILYSHVEPNGRIVACDDNYVIHESNDGGYNWIQVFTVTSGQPKAIDFFGDNVICIACRDIIYITQDGGATWRNVVLRGVSNMSDFNFTCVIMLDDHSMILAECQSGRGRMYRMDF